MTEINKETLAAAEKAVEERQEEIGIDDIAPSGALSIGKFPARSYSMADQIILEKLMLWFVRSGETFSDVNIAAVVIYCAIQVSNDDISNLCRNLEANESFFYETIIPWLATISEDEFAAMVIDSKHRLDEFRSALEVVKSAAGGEESGEVVAATN